jgi:cytochrome c peroxidase
MAGFFFDANLSVHVNQSCATCHAPEAGWTGPHVPINAHGGVYEGDGTRRSAPSTASKGSTADGAWLAATSGAARTA